MNRSRPQTFSGALALRLALLVPLALFGTACSATPERAPAVDPVRPPTLLAQADLTPAQADEVFLREEAARRAAWEPAARSTPGTDEVVRTPAAATVDPSPREVGFERVAPAEVGPDPLAPTFGDGRAIDAAVRAPAAGLPRASGASGVRRTTGPASVVPTPARVESRPDPIQPAPAESTPAAPLRNFRDLYRRPQPVGVPESNDRTRRITRTDEAAALRALATSGSAAETGPRVVRLPGPPSADRGFTSGQVGWHGAREAARRSPAVDGAQGVMVDLLLGQDGLRVH